MENTASTLENLFDKAKVYGETSIELFTLKSVCKSADISSSIAAKLAVASVVAFFLLLVNIGLAFWIGEELGKIYYGFFVVATFYLILAIFIFIFKNKWIKIPVSNFIITRMLKKN
jgi:hypothetical protein